MLTSRERAGRGRERFTTDNPHGVLMQTRSDRWGGARREGVERGRAVEQSA